MKQEEARRKLEEELKRKEAEKAKELAKAMAEKEKNKKAALAKITNKSTAHICTTKPVNTLGKLFLIWLFFEKSFVKH